MIYIRTCVGISFQTTHHRCSDLFHRKHPLSLATDPYQVPYETVTFKAKNQVYLVWH